MPVLLLATLFVAVHGRDIVSALPVHLPAINGAMLDIRESFALRDAATGTPEWGGAVWPAADILCRWMAAQQQDISGSRVLELGSGTGACGIYAAALGASRVTLTDGGGDELLELMRCNVERNRHLFGDADVAVERLVWGGGAPCGSQRDFDYVIAADALYGIGEADEASHDAAARGEALADTLASLLLDRRARPPRVVVGHCYRSRELSERPLPWDAGDDVLAAFLGAASRRGLRVDTLASERPRVVSADGDAEISWSSDLALLEVGRTPGRDQVT